MTSDPILTVKKLSVAFGGLQAVNDVSFTVGRRTITSLIGPNGAGKTTVFNLINRQLFADRGVVRYGGVAIDNLTPHHIARLGLGRTFQDPRVFLDLTVLENVLIGFQKQIGEGSLAAMLRPAGMRRQEAWQARRARQLLQIVGLTGRAADLADDLSYGQQRFLSIARVLAAEPALLLMDEPTVGLHHQEIQRLTTLLSEMVRERQLSVLLIEHNMDVVMSVSDWVYLLVEGGIVAQGEPATIKHNAHLISAYLGTSLEKTGRE